MQTAAKVLMIIGLIVGIIWAVVGFFGTLIGGGTIAGLQSSLTNDQQAAQKTVQTSADLMMSHLGSFVVTLIGGILGIVGCGPITNRPKPMILGGLTLIAGMVMFILLNWVAAILYIVAGFLIILSGALFRPPQESEINLSQ